MSAPLKVYQLVPAGGNIIGDLFSQQKVSAELVHAQGIEIKRTETVDQKVMDCV